MTVPVVYIDAEAISGITGSISIACWVIVFTPQLYENQQNTKLKWLWNIFHQTKHQDRTA
jgi:hypothetical protein